MRIAIVTEYYYPHRGGITEHVHFFAREARRRGHHVDVITSHIPGAQPQPGVIRLGRGVPVLANGSMARFTVGYALRRRMRETLRRGRYDIVHVHTVVAPTLPLLAVDEAECPVVGTFHAYFESSRAYAALRRYFQPRVDRLNAAIAVSPAARDAHARYFDADWQIIPNGIDVDLFNPAAAAPPGLPGDTPVVLFLGRFDPRNGLGVLLRAFRKVRGRRRPARLLVVGDGPLRPYYRALARGIPDVAFVGAVRTGRPGYYAHSAIYACPTTGQASFGITLLESMACATPVVCSDIAGFRSVAEHGREALMTPRRDVDALAAALVELLDDDALRERLGHAGRQRALRYSWPAVADDVLAVYARLLGDASAAA